MPEKDGAAMARSLEGRKLLRGLKLEQLKALQSRIGDEAYRRVQMHDRLLDIAADNLRSSSKKPSPPKKPVAPAPRMR
jgi:hypothetical protein